MSWDASLWLKLFKARTSTTILSSTNAAIGGVYEVGVIVGRRMIEAASGFQGANMHT